MCAGREDEMNELVIMLPLLLVIAGVLSFPIVMSVIVALMDWLDKRRDGRTRG